MALNGQSHPDPRTLWSYRERRGDLRPTLGLARRAVEVPRVFRIGFLADFLAGFVFVLVDRTVVELFFFAGAAADFAFGVVFLVRLLAAPIAAPESAPITVPTTGTPSADPATAPAAAPPRVLPAVPVAVSVAP